MAPLGWRGVVSARVGLGTQNTRAILSRPHPARSMKTAPTIILMFVSWLLGMQNTFSHGDRFFLPFFFFKWWFGSQAGPQKPIYPIAELNYKTSGSSEASLNP